MNSMQQREIFQEAGLACGNEPCRKRLVVIETLTPGALKWAQTITHRIDHMKAPAIFNRINKRDKEIMRVVIDWKEA